MRRCFALMLLPILLVGFSACASVEIYSKPDLKKENRTGLKIYHSKPYLLVMRTGAKDNPISVQVVHLQDFESPQYARYRPGVGSSQLNLEMTNSILAKFGQTADTKLPETLTAVGSLLGSAAGAFKTVREGQQLEQQALDFGKIKKAGEDLLAISKQLKEAAEQAAADNLNLTPAQRQQVATTVDALNTAGTKLTDPIGMDDQKVKGVLNTLEPLVNTWDTMKLNAPAGDTPAGRYDNLVARLKDNVSAVMQTLKAMLEAPPAPPAPAVFELYEIRQSGGKTELIRVQEVQGARP